MFGVKADSDISTICTFAAFLGVVHVLAGADHLSALSMLATNKKFPQSLFLGIRWGLGHSTGLMIIAAVFFGISQSYEFLDSQGAIADKIVGFMMIFLGLYGCFSLYFYRDTYLNGTDEVAESHHPLRWSHFFDANHDIANVEEGPSTNPPIGGNTRGTAVDLEEVAVSDLLTQAADESSGDYIRRHHRSTAHSEEVQGQHDQSPSDSRRCESEKSSEVDVEAPQHAHSNTSNSSTDSDRKWLSFSLRHPRTAKVVSLCVGIIHGVSGPGGVLGVLPAVTLHNPRKSAAYLGIFFLASIAAMGAFTSVFGYLTCALENATRARWFSYYMCMFTSILSICVGIVWLAISFTSDLEEYGLRRL
jgi:VIT1/CCC1 family predicted Fe2+/Mn2+ transporter